MEEEKVLEVVPVNQIEPPQKTFSLKPLLDEHGLYSLKNFDQIKESCRAFIDENSIASVSTADEVKQLKKCRTVIRKQKDFLRKVRLSLVKLFSFQISELENMLEDADNNMKRLKEEYDASLVVEEETKVESEIKDREAKTITLKITYYDSNIIESLKKMAVDNGCTITEIKEK